MWSREKELESAENIAIMLKSRKKEIPKDVLIFQKVRAIIKPATNST